jgi:S1-C subfamily serine protease
MNLTDLSTQLLFTTVPIWVRKASGMTTGTSFIYNVPVSGDPARSIPLLVTNYHVVDQAIGGVIELVERSGDQPVLQKRVRASLDAATLLSRVDPELDIALIPLGPLLNQLDATQRPVFFRSIGPDIVPDSEIVSELSAMEEVVFVGYPSGLRDEHNSTPLIRRGITASPVWNDFGNKPVFIIDAGVYPGSSGSPVFILNQGSYASKSGIVVGTRFLFLGVLSDTLVRPEPGGNTYIGLGRVVKSSAVKIAIDSFASIMAK